MDVENFYLCTKINIHHMTIKNSRVVELEQVVIRFAGDSGDGMQLTGSLFSDSTAFAGNDFATFPDYPSEIRAPQGTVSGVSGFQIHFGQKTVYTSGDLADVLVAMNPASLKANMRWVKEGAIIIVDGDAFVGSHPGDGEVDMPDPHTGTLLIPVLSDRPADLHLSRTVSGSAAFQSVVRDINGQRIVHDGR